MAYQKKQWKNRVSDYPTRRLITPVGQGDAFVAEIERNEGTITEEGDPFNAATMNDLENRIEQGIGAGSAIIAGEETTSTASKAYSVNQFLIYDNKLYKVIAAIAQGASLVEGTNISETTVADQMTLGLTTDASQNSSINTLNGQLTAGSTHFYFDYKNGKWGWNSSPARGAGTFHPFRQASSAGTYTADAQFHVGGSEDGFADSVIELPRMTGDGVLAITQSIISGTKGSTEPADNHCIGSITVSNTTQGTSVSYSRSGNNQYSVNVTGKTLNYYAGDYLRIEVEAEQTESWHAYAKFVYTLTE